MDDEIRFDRWALSDESRKRYDAMDDEHKVAYEERWIKSERKNRELIEEFSYSMLSEKERQKFDKLDYRDQRQYKIEYMKILKKKESVKKQQARLQKKVAARDLENRKADTHRKILIGGVLAEILGRPLTDDDWKTFRAFLIFQQSEGRKHGNPGYVSAFFDRAAADPDWLEGFQNLD